MADFVTKIRTNDGDKQIDYNALANLPELNTMFSNPNLLINSDFRNPVNQRGQTSYTISDNAYTIDRWRVLSNAGTLSVNDGYVKLSSDGSTPSYFVQKIESVSVDDYITVSINVKSITGVLNVYIASASQEECFSIYSSGVTTYTTSVKFTDFMQLNIEAFDGASVELYWAKVEQGTNATPFVAKLYDEELAICRRYFRSYKNAMLFPQFYENQYYGMRFDVPMRAQPVAKNFSMIGSDGSEASVGASVQVDTEGVLKFFTIDTYRFTSVKVTSLELDAEIY